MEKSKKLKDILFTIAFPIVVFIIMEALCYFLKGKHIITTVGDIKTLVRNTGIASMTAFALSFNLKAGRFDLSLGAQRLAGCIIGGTIAINLGLRGFGLLLFSLVFGLIFGFLTGLAFVTLRVPPMVLGIGMGLVWEVVPYEVTGGKGLNLYGVSGMESINNTAFIIGVVLVVAFLVMILLQYTTFGYESRAVQGNQLVAQNSGIDIFKNTVLAYTFAGGLVCVAGVLNVAYTTQLAASLGLTSNGVVTAHMFAMMLGGYIGERSNESIGIIVAALTISIFKYALALMEFSEANNSVINMTVFVLFLVFLANRYFFKKRKDEQARIKLAKEELATL